MSGKCLENDRKMTKHMPGKRPENSPFRPKNQLPDPDEVRYWEIFGLLRWASINLMQAYGHVELGRSSVVFAACGRNCAEIEYDLLKTIDGTLD